MTTYDPPLDDGFDGDRYLPTDIERVGTTPNDAHAPGCYVLRCHRPETDALADFRRLYREATDADAEMLPPWLEQLPYTAGLLYVGASGDVYDRLDDHIHGEVRQVGFLRAFPPHSIVSLHFTDDPFTYESQLAIDVAREYPDEYVHCR